MNEVLSVTVFKHSFQDGIKSAMQLRDVWALLGSTMYLNSWAAKALKKLRLGIDYTVHKQQALTSEITQFDCVCSLDAVKKLCIMEKSKGGANLYGYIVEVEKMQEEQIVMDGWEPTTLLDESAQESIAHPVAEPPMPTISPFKFGGVEVNSVNLREVHTFLESRQKFSDWAKNRLCDFVEGTDFIVHKTMTQYNQIDTIEYIVTIDTAKHICMLERNAKGKELRQYFINCEKRALAQTSQLSLPDFTDPAEAAIAWAEQFRAKRLAEARAAQLQIESEEAKRVVAEQAPKVEFYDSYMNRDGTIDMGQAAKVLGLGRTRLFELLRETGVFMGTVPKQTFIDRGYFVTKISSGDNWSGAVAKVTPKGMEWLSKQIKGKA
jgi:anti-repressor protein